MKLAFRADKEMKAASAGGKSSGGVRREECVDSFLWISPWIRIYSVLYWLHIHRPANSLRLKMRINGRLNVKAVGLCVVWC